jgi:hypothetical protein
MIEVKVALSVQVAGGPQVSIPTTVEVEAYEKIEVTVPASKEDKPGSVRLSLGKQLNFLLIKSSWFSKEKQELKYKIGEGGKEIQLDQPHLYLGEGAVSLFAAKDLETVTFTNSYKEEAQIEILTAGKAVLPAT